MYSATTGTDDSVTPKPVTAASRYESLMQRRQPYLERAREMSRLTIPSLLPPEGSNGMNLYKPFQSTGADGVNNLAAKLLMALFPPGTPFFRLTIDDFVLEELSQNVQGKDARGEFEAALGKIERSVVNRMEQKGSRKVHFEALQHFIVAGNGLIYCLKDGSEKFFPLDRYVVSRDLDGNVLEIVVKECIAREALPEHIQEAIAESAKTPSKDQSSEEEIEVYTWIQRDKHTWLVHQEVCGKEIAGSRGSYPLDKCAWLVLRWTRISGEDYGRGRCEEYQGDLYSLEALTKAIVQFSSAAAKVLAFVNEAGVTSKEDVARAESGDVLDGNAADVTFLMMEKSQDFNVAKTVADEVKARLERAFLMASSIQRQAERVTAEEIRVMAGELEQGLGGVYSILSEEFQRPLVTRLMHVMSMERPRRIPRLPQNTVSPQIVTGLDGLGRNTDMQRLDTLIAGTGQQFGQEALAQYVNIGAYMARRGAALGIDLNGLIRSEEEIQQMRQAATQQALAGKLGGPAIKAMSDNAVADKKLGQQPAQQPTTPQ